jgi:hypothetical protein
MQLASSRLTDRDHCIHNEQNQRKISGRYWTKWRNEKRNSLKFSAKVENIKV